MGEKFKSLQGSEKSVIHIFEKLCATRSLETFSYLVSFEETFHIILVHSSISAYGNFYRTELHKNDW